VCDAKQQVSNLGSESLTETCTFSLSSGRYDIKIFQSFFQLHGKTFDYKIPMSTVLRLFILPHKDSRQMFFVVSGFIHEYVCLLKIQTP
jgi:hypothetical protein